MKAIDWAIVGFVAVAFIFVSCTYSQNQQEQNISFSNITSLNNTTTEVNFTKEVCDENSSFFSYKLIPLEVGVDRTTVQLPTGNLRLNMLYVDTWASDCARINFSINEKMFQSDICFDEGFRVDVDYRTAVIVNDVYTLQPPMGAGGAVFNILLRNESCVEKPKQVVCNGEWVVDRMEDIDVGSLNRQIKQIDVNNKTIEILGVNDDFYTTLNTRFNNRDIELNQTDLFFIDNFTALRLGKNPYGNPPSWVSMQIEVLKKNESCNSN